MANSEGTTILMEDGQNLAEPSAASMQVASEASARASLYSLLSRVFLKETDADFAELLGQPNIAVALSEMGVSIDGPALVSSLETLAHEYCYLFIGPGPHLPPFESANARATEDDQGKTQYGQLLGEQAMEVERTYRSYGLELGGELKDQPDHLAAELAFMAHLCELEAGAVLSGTEAEAAVIAAAQKDFLIRHLGAWAPGFCRSVMEACEADYYSDFASLTAGFVDSELAVART